MLDRRVQLCVAIVFIVLYDKVTAKQLDMAPDAVDDLYNGCRTQAQEKFITSGLLGKEVNGTVKLQKAWSSGTACQKQIPGGTVEHASALWAYACADRKFRTTFNDAVETMGVNVSTYETNFHFKSLHFLLMDTMKLLHRNNCRTAYLASSTKYTAQKGSKVRFGRFISAYSDDLEVMEDPDLDGGVLFNITSCFILDVEHNTCQQEDIELLISPAEVFEVVEVKDVAGDYSYTQIVLKHSALLSSKNCYIFNRSPADSSALHEHQHSFWLVLVLMTFSLFFN